MKLLKTKSFLVKAALSAIIIGVMAMRLDMNEAHEVFHHIYPQAWLLALALIFLQILALSYRWLLLINVDGKKMDYAGSVRITLASLLANYLFITSIGGIIVRVALAVQQDVSLVKAIAATTLDRLMTVVGLLILTIIFLPVLANAVAPDIFQNTLIAVAIFVVAFAMFPFLLFKNVRKNLIFANRKIAVCFKYLRSVATDTDLIAKITASSLLAQLAYFGAVYTITTSTGADFSLMYFMAVLPMITIVASLPVGYGGWGIREGAFVYGLGLIHVPFETAFIVSVQIGLISMIAALLAGIPALMSPKTRFALKKFKASRAR